MALTKKRTEKYLEMAKEVSHNSDFPRFHLGAVLMYKGSVLATGYNSCKTSPVQKKYNREREYLTNASYAHTNCLHAEVHCLNKIKYLDIDFSKAILFVYREHRNGKKALARPCPACTKMIKDLGIKNVVYTTENGYCNEYYD